MPTPFYHLSVAEDVLGHPALPFQVRTILHSYRSEFLLGNTAPDVQAITGQDRVATHFFDLPVLPDSQPAWECFLSNYPALADPSALRPEHAAFIAGYLCHLQADWYWIFDIFAPVFGPKNNWQSFPQRLYLHNVLRSYLDQKLLPHLPRGLADDLCKASPFDWLPFASDQSICQWRDLLARQLQPGAPFETVEIFAARQGIPPEEFYELIRSEDRLDAEIFSRLPREVLLNYRERLSVDNLRLLEAYLLG